MATLDIELEMLLVKKEHFEKNPSIEPLAVGLDEPLFIAVKFHGDVGALAAAGFEAASVIPPIAFGRTTVAGLEALARHPQVESIEKQRRSHLYLDGSVSEIKANQVWSRTGDAFSGYTGRGVIVGIIDSGIDFRHKAFRKPDGTSRVLRIWDQTLTPLTIEGPPDPITDPTIATTPTPLNYGVEYTIRHINDTLESSDAVVPVRHVDADGHGTHVAAIAAGDGSQKGHCHGIYRYVGVAPEADLMVVRLWGLTTGDTAQPATANSVLIDAIRYLMNAAAGRPLVINLSLGRFGELMDGSSTTCTAIDTLLTAHSTGRAIVFSAGNDGGSGFHAAASVPVGGAANTLRLPFTMPANDTRKRTLVVRYIGANLQARVISPVPGNPGIVNYAALGGSQISITANGPNSLVMIRNNPNRISVEITPPVGGTNQANTWVLELQNSGAAPTAIDAFCLFGSPNSPSPRFTTATTSRSTLNEHATGQQTIAVGSYAEGGGLSTFSSRGPTTDLPARAIPKPELAAPGEDIASAGIAKDRTGCRQCCCVCCQQFWVDKSGTSQAAPHVAGTIALMLHKNPTLTHVQIRNFLIQNTSARPANATPDEILGWGRGRLNAKQVLDAVAQINPPAIVAGVAVSESAAGIGGVEVSGSGARVGDLDIAGSAMSIADTDAPLVQLQNRLLATTRGPLLAGLFEKYGAEVWNLIQTNRRVATIWHRCKGPIWVRLALKAVYAPHVSLRLDADGLGLHDALLRFAGALKRFGSPALRQDLEALEPEFALVEDGMSVHAIIDALGNH